MSVKILIGDVFDQLRSMPDASVDSVVTSPPYWGLRSYLKDDDPNKAREIGLERTLGEHLDVLVRVFREVRRVLKPHGTVFLNYGDCYATSPNGRAAADVVGDDRTFRDKPFSTVGAIYGARRAQSYDTAGRAELDFLGRDSTSENPDDARTGVSSSRNADSNVRLALAQVHEFLPRIQERMASLLAHLPIEGCSDRTTLQQSCEAILDCAPDLALRLVWLRDALASTMTGSSQQRPEGSRLSSIASACQSSLRSFELGVRRLARIADDDAGWPDCKAGTAELSEQLANGIQCTAECCSWLASWQDIEPKRAPTPVAGGFLKNKDLCMIPNRLAIALQDDGWWVRSEIIWAKPNPMPESVYDRPTSAHEKIWLLTKNENYFFNAEALREPASPNTHARVSQNVAAQKGSLRANGGSRPDRPMKAVVRAVGPNSRINVDRVPRSRKAPAGWDTSTGEGRHGEVMSDEKRVTPKARADHGSRRARNNASMDAALLSGGAETARAKKMRGRAEEMIKSNERFAAATQNHVDDRNIRNVWQISPKAFKEAHFACVDEWTEALTPDGWKLHKALQDGDQIAAYDLETGVSVWQPATFHRYPFDGELVSIEKRDSSQMLTPNHRCLVRRQDQNPTVVLAEDLKPGMDVPVSAPLVVGEDGSGPGESFAALLGWYLANGERKRGNIVRIHKSQSAHPERVEQIRGLLGAAGAEFTEKARQTTYQGRPYFMVEFAVRGRVANRLDAMSPGKSISLAWLKWSQSEIRALLRGIVEGDGHARSDGRECIIHKDRAFVEAAQILALKIGKHAVVSRRGSSHVVYLTDGHWLTLRGTNGVFQPIKRQRYVGTVWCPSVPSTFWLARRSGKTFITGNTFPPALAKRCIMGGTPPTVCGFCGAVDGCGGICEQVPRQPGVVLDPFGGAGTVGLVARELGLNAVLIELNADYAEMARKRIFGDQQQEAAE